jgi:hypothetical protein
MRAVTIRCCPVQHPDTKLYGIELWTKEDDDPEELIGRIGGYATMEEAKAESVKLRELAQQNLAEAGMTGFQRLDGIN